MKKSSLLTLGVLTAGLSLIAVELIPLFSLPTAAAAAKKIAFPTNAAAKGAFPKRWNYGSESPMDNKDPVVQVHWYNEHTVMLRENKAYSSNGNFFFLYFGNEKALLLDQGAIYQPEISPLRQLIDGLVAEWCKRNGRDDIHLVLTNTHLHGDHYAQWNQFLDRPNTTLVGLTFEERMDFFGIKNFPEQRAEYDLGGRKLILVGAPGHEDSELAIYDTWTRLLCTGDMLYWGLITIRDWKKWEPSIQRLAKFTYDHPVVAITNCHIEMSAQNIDYPRKTVYQPEEPPMEIDVETLRKLAAFTKTITDPKPGVYYFDKIWLYNEVGGGVALEKNIYAYE
jgi:glyoxylase-like metal-dependent hydrolase (beta-lactamase superfamily II)